MSGIKFPSPVYRQLSATLLDAGGVESCAIAYAHHVAHADAWIVADAAAVPEHAYERRDHISAVLKAQYLLDLANRSRVTGMAAILIHTHPDCSTWPVFSTTDDDGEAQLAPYLGRRGAPVPHAALVISPNGCRARRLGSGDEIGVWEVGRHLTLLSPRPDGEAQERHDRQVRAFGEPGQRLLKSLRYCVVGAGGTGSLVCQQLAHLGARDITVIDPDNVETTNLNRVVGSTSATVGVAKVEVVAAMIRNINPDARVTALQADIVDGDVANLLPTFDFILLCTDSHASRAVVNQAAHQFLVPVIDMGVSITVKDDVITHITGRVQMIAPELPCLTCTGALDGRAILRELQTPEQRAADPYVQGVHEPQPAVISINSTVTSLAITMLLGAVTPVPTRPRHLSYNGIRGRVSELAAAIYPECIVCSSAGAHAKGLSWPMPVRHVPNDGEAA